MYAATIACPDKGTAEKIFGAGGLMTVFSKLAPAGWGGCEAIGGSPRGARLSLEEARAAARILAGSMK